MLINFLNVNRGYTNVCVKNMFLNVFRVPIAAFKKKDSTGYC